MTVKALALLVPALTVLLPLSRLAAEVPEMAAGLEVTEYPRHASQVDRDHIYIPIDQFGDPIGKGHVAQTLSGWKHDTDRNAIAQGFLLIEEDGEYAFTTDSFYDRNLLMIDGKLICEFRDGGDHIAKIQLKKGAVPILSAGYVEGRGGSQGIDVRWQPPGQRELSGIPRSQLRHAGKAKVSKKGKEKEKPKPKPAPKPKSVSGLRADSMVVVAKDFVIEAYLNGVRIPDADRHLLLDRFGATVERIDAEVKAGDWLVFHVAHNRLRHGGTKFFAVAGGLEGGRRSFVSDPDSEQWSVCDDPTGARDFIRWRDEGTEARAMPIAKPWEEGMKFMRKYSGDDFSGKALWGAAPSTWIKFVVPGGPKTKS